MKKIGKNNYVRKEFGETPLVEIEQYPIITDIKEMLEYDCKIRIIKS